MAAQDAGGRSDSNLTPDPELSDDALLQPQADAVYRALLDRVAESSPRPRLDPTRLGASFLGDPQLSAPVIHIAGTNGKSSTSRMVESLLRATGLRTGTMISPHLSRVNERILIDGEPISNEALIANWRDIEPYIAMADERLTAEGEHPLTFFEALTLLAFAAFADAPVDVMVLETGMGGEWDSTNIAEAAVSVLTPIALDHTHRLGSTLEEIAQTKAGIIKSGGLVVSAAQHPVALAAVNARAATVGAPVAVEDEAFAVEGSVMAVGGQLVTVRGRAATYSDVYLPLYGAHQAHNAAVAIAAVESFVGGGEQALAHDVVEEAFATVTSPGRLELVGTEPTVLVDAAHNPHGAASLVSALQDFFDFDELALVVGVLEDKDIEGMLRVLAPAFARIHATQSASDRAVPSDDVAYLLRDVASDDVIWDYEDAGEAIEAARQWAAEHPKRAVVVTGSITLVGETIDMARARGWKA